MAAVIEVEELRRPDGGRVRVLGLDPGRDGPGLGQRIGAQLQKAALPDRLKVWEALDLYASFYDRPVAWPELLDRWDWPSAAARPSAPCRAASASGC
jgi:ABC-2 type transport system ATP-binding protein